MCGTRYEGYTPAGIEVRLLGKRELVVNPEPVEIARSLPVARPTLGKRWLLTLPNFVSKLSLSPVLTLVELFGLI